MVSHRKPANCEVRRIAGLERGVPDAGGVGDDRGRGRIGFPRLTGAYAALYLLKAVQRDHPPMLEPFAFAGGRDYNHFGFLDKKLRNESGSKRPRENHPQETFIIVSRSNELNPSA